VRSVICNENSRLGKNDPGREKGFKERYLCRIRSKRGVKGVGLVQKAKERRSNTRMGVKGLDIAIKKKDEN